MPNFYTEARSTLVELGCTRQQSNEDLSVYLRILCENALDYCDPVSDAMLVSVCLHRMTEEDRVFLEPIFPLLSKLMEAARRTTSWCPDPRSLARASKKPGHPIQKKRLIFAAHDDAEEARLSRLKQPTFERKEKLPNSTALPL